MRAAPVPASSLPDFSLSYLIISRNTHSFNITSKSHQLEDSYVLKLPFSSSFHITITASHSYPLQSVLFYTVSLQGQKTSKLSGCFVTHHCVFNNNYASAEVFYSDRFRTIPPGSSATYTFCYRLQQKELEILLK